MNRISRGLLLGAVLALLSVCISAAQATVSVVKVDVTRVGDAVIFELHTTGPGGFSLDRVTEPGAVTAWSELFLLDKGFTETMLDLDHVPMGTIVSEAAMFSEPWRSGLRIYLGPDADSRNTSVVNEARRTVVRIPVVGAAAAPAAGEPGRLLDTGEELAVDELMVAEQVTATDAAEGVVTAATQAALLPPAMPEPVIVPDPEIGSDVVDVIAVPEPAAAVDSPAGGSFFVPRAESADVNYQFEPVNDLAGAPQESGDAGSEDIPLEDIGNLLGEVFTELGAQLGETAEPDVQAAFSTPGDPAMDGSFQAQAMVSVQENGAPNGKNALTDITIDLFEIINTPLDQAITLLIAPTDYNVIVDSSVRENTISLSFKDKQTDLKSALDLITKVYGLEYVVQAHTIVVATKEKMAGNLMAYESRLFILSYADPMSVKDILINTALLGENQVEIYAGETEYAQVNDSTLLSTTAESGNTQIKPMESNLSSTPRNALLVKALPDDMQMIAGVIAELDRQPKIIELEVRVCEATESAMKDLGIDFNSNASTPIATSTVWTEQPGDVFTDDDAIEAFTAGSFYRSPLQFLLSLNTQIQEGSVELLAQPTLSTVEGKQAIYFAGEEIPYISQVSQAATGQTQIQVDFLNVGITLNFKPRLDADGKLTIDVNPIVSSLLEFRIIADLVEAPRTSTRQAATTVRVESGEPFVLAGLITETERTSITKIPVLGDLPMLGKLFRNKNKKGERTEIIIVVTPLVHN